jgi:hypothetical protein
LSTRARWALGALSCVAVATSAAFFFLLVFAPAEHTVGRPRSFKPESDTDRRWGSSQQSWGNAESPGEPDDLFATREKIEDGGFSTATRFTGPIHQTESLEELRDAIKLRGRLGLAILQAELDHIPSVPRTPRQRGVETARLLFEIGLLHLYDGRLSAASSTFEKALELDRHGSLPPRVRAELMALRGVIALRQGELDNSMSGLVASSDVVPIAPEAVQVQDKHTRQAIEHLTASLHLVPGNLQARWLLNVAHMRLGEYPGKVPAEYRIALDGFRSAIQVAGLDNVARLVGLTAAGPKLAGGSVFDDFTGDGWPDLLTTSLDLQGGASLRVNRRDGTFEQPSAAAGLRDQVYALNAAAADFDNDGHLDVLLLRGGWERPLRMSLLRNNGDGTFEDVTIASGLGEPIATGSAAWGDYDNDGWVDLFVCGEYAAAAHAVGRAPPDARNRCRLYHNRGNGTFTDVAQATGVVNKHLAKGAAWGDYDGDGLLDLFVANFDAPCRLYRNEGNGAFRDVASEAGVAGPPYHGSFACWFWDFDNDGRLDLFVNNYNVAPADVVAAYLGQQSARAGQPRLYRNLGRAGFHDVSEEAGLNRQIPAIGANFGDIDNDGYLDAYFGNGWYSYSGLVPNVMLKNIDGRRFEDVTFSTRTGHLKRGNGISFADYDRDGDLDLFVRTGGLVPGDTAHDLLFRNPGHKRHWLKVKLVGTKTNRAALGASIRVELRDADGRSRSIYRTVGNNSSSGGNCLVELIGILDATTVARLTTSWPTSRTSQTFRDLACDQEIEISEGASSYKVVERSAVTACVR